MVITITIPGEPAAKGRPRIGRGPGGRPVAVTPGKTRTREGIIASLAMDAMGGRAPMDGPLHVTVRAILPISRSWPKKRQLAASGGLEHPTKRPDADNLAKLATDALNGIVWHDDSQIVALMAIKEYGTEPRTVITVQDMAV